MNAPSWLDRDAYPFTDRRATLQAGRMHYVDEGRGEPILFIHGTPTWSFEYRHLITALSVARRCVAPDHFGFGLSDRPATFPYTPEAHAAALREFVERLDLRDLTLVVHDFGGPIGLPLALDQPGRVKRLVVINTWMWPFDDDTDMQKKGRIAASPLGRWMYRNLNFSLRILAPSAYGNRKALTPAIHRQYLEPFRDKDARVLVLHALARAINGSRDYYASLLQRADRLRELPALIIWGLKDSAFRPHLLARWKKLLPDAKVIELADAGHWPHEEEPEAVVQALKTFV